MPTASGYITVTGQSVSAKTDWTNPTNVAGAPDGSVASVTAGLGNTENLVFSHGITIPNGSVVSEVRATVRIKGATASNMTFRVYLAGTSNSDTVLLEGPVVLPTGTLQDLELTETRELEIGNCTPSRVNDGSGYFQVNATDGAVAIEIDSVLLEIDYTVARNVAPYCNRNFVKSPLIALP